MADSTAEPISPIGASKPELTLSAASINSEPVELDGTPTSPERVRQSRRGSRDDALKGLSAEEKERRAQVAKQREVDPAILQNIPQTPGAEELEKSGATVTKEASASTQ